MISSSSKHLLFWYFLRTSLGISWFEIWFLEISWQEHSFAVQNCESWSEVNWSPCECPVSVEESCNIIKMSKITTFLIVSRNFLEIFLVRESGFWILCVPWVVANKAGGGLPPSQDRKLELCGSPDQMLRFEPPTVPRTLYKCEKRTLRSILLLR